MSKEEIMNSLSLIGLSVTLIFSTSTTLAANSIVGSMSKSETELGTENLLVMEADPLSENANHLRPELGSSTIERMQFTEQQEYAFKTDEKIYPYLEVKLTRTDRLRVLADGRIRFLVKRGSLQANLESLMGHTLAKTYFPPNFPSSMRMFNDFDLTGNNILEIADQMLEPWGLTDNVFGRAHINDVVEFGLAFNPYR